MITYRQAQRTELELILSWAAAEGWNPGLGDAAVFWPADPHGFFVALDQETPVAAISVVNHTNSFAFLGLYIVLPAYRGRGIGYGLWQHAIAHAGDRTIGLDGVPDQQSNYEASGFCHAGATTRFAGPVSPKAAPGIEVAKASDISRLITREAQASGIEKTRYLTQWFSNSADRQTFVHDRGFCTCLLYTSPSPRDS